MDKEKQTRLIHIHPFVILIIMILTILLITFIGLNQIIKQENNLYEVILKADADLSEISIDGLRAESYYAESSYAYEDGDYNEVERNCRLARDYFFDEGQGYKKIKAELKDKEINEKLITLYLEKLELLSEITNNMFEACEHFESAARYFYTYYNTDVSFDDISYDMGNGEIEMMNEKIKAHDNAVERYNNKLAEFKVELEKRLN